MSGDSRVDLQQSGSMNHDHDENEQVLQPKIKRKRSIRLRPRPAAERPDDKSVDRSSILRGQSSHLPVQPDQRLHAKTQADRKLVQENNIHKNEQSNLSTKAKRTPPARKIAGQPTRTNPISGPSEVSNEYSKDRLDVKVKKGSGPYGGTMMTEAIQRRVCAVISRNSYTTMFNFFVAIILP